MSDEVKEEPKRRLPNPPTRFVTSLDGPKPGELQASRDLTKAFETMQQAPTMAQDVVASLHVQQKLEKAKGKQRNFHRPVVNPQRSVTKPANAPGKSK